MKEQRMVDILQREYTLAELEERLELKPKDLENGWFFYVDQNYDTVQEFLREDLWFD